MEPSLNVADMVPLLDDRDPQAIFDEWLAAVQAADPTYRPVNGALETIIAEALCLSVSDVIYAVNRLPGTAVEALLALMGIPRFPGTPVSGQVVITFDGERTVTVPWGSRMLIDGLEFTASETVSATGSSITVPVVSSDMLSLANGLPAGTGVDLLDPIPVAVAAATTGVFAGGSDPETDAAFKARAVLAFAINQQGLVLPSAFATYCAGLIDVSRAYALDLYDPDTGTAEGHMTVFLWGHGQALGTAREAEIEADLQARSISNLQVHVLPVTVITVDVEIEVRLARAESATVIAAVETALRQAISPAVWTWGESVTPEEIAAIAARVNGVDYATDVIAPAAPVEIEYLGYLPSVGTVTVTIAETP